MSISLRCNSECQFHNIQHNLYKQRRRKKFDKNKNVKKYFLYFISTGQKENTKAVMFIKFAMYRCVCACMSIRNNREKEKGQLVLTHICMCVGMCKAWYL